jgi:hypothetical protein
MTGVREEARRADRPDAGSKPALLPRLDHAVAAGIVVISSHTENLFMVKQPPLRRINLQPMRRQ